MTQRAHNAKVPPVTYRGRLYNSVTTLYHAYAQSRGVSLTAFRNRVWAAWKNGRLSETRIEDALTLSQKQYQRKYSRRITWVEVDGHRCDLWRVHKQISESQDTVAYGKFWQRVRNLEPRLNALAGQFGKVAALNGALVVKAATNDNASWRRGWGAARISPLVYGEKLYPTYREFAHAMGRQDDVSLIRNRLKHGVSPESALEPRVPQEGGLIYLITQKSTGLEYVGLTSTSLQQRWHSHLSSAEKGSLSKLHEAIRNAGSGDFRFEVLEDGIKTEEELCECEVRHIESRGTLWPSGFNSLSGGQAGGGRPKPCVFEGEEFRSVGDRNRILGERYGQSPEVINRLINTERPLDTPVRTVHDEHLGNESWQRQWISVLRSAKRGEIELHPEWNKAEAWMRDIAPDKNEGNHLVHLDPSKPFAPGNVKWMTNQEKMAHQHGVSIWCHGKEYASTVDLAKAYGVKRSTLRYRINERGMTPEQAVSVGAGPTAAKQIEVDGVTYSSIRKASLALADISGIPFEIARYRLRRRLGQRAGGGHPSRS